MHCHKCKKEIDLHDKKIGFKDFCENCDFDLHICKNCKYYSIGKPNDCSIPNIEAVTDKEKNNFCEEFIAKNKLENENFSSKEDVGKKLFSNFEEEDDDKDDFNSLFKG